MNNQNQDILPQEGNTEQKKDEALFDALSKSKKQRRRKTIRTVVLATVIVIVILTAAVLVLRRRVREQFAITNTEVMSAAAERGTISTVVSGSGTLENVDTEIVSLPEGVEATEILASFGDTVAQGDLLVTVDMATVRTAMSQLQEEIDQLDDEITAAEGDHVSSYISAGVAGRVKAIYAQEGTAVADAMAEHGALAVLSLDGHMAVEIPAGDLEEGDAVTVVRQDGTTVEATVESLAGETATILLTDDGPTLDEAVTVQSEFGEELGQGKLYIHNPLFVTGYAGTVNGISVQENQKVSASSTVFTLTDTSTSANYDALLQTRKECQEELLELLQIQRYGGLTAPISGSVSAVADLEEDAEVTDLVTLAPDVSMSVTISVDEGDILSLALDQTADVTVSSIGDQTLEGVVTEIDKTASDGTYTAVITLDKVEGMLAGMTANVDVRIEGVDDAILIPAEALHQTSTGYYVYTTYDEDTQEFGGKVDVVPGLSNSNYVEIKSGLAEGDTVYYSEEPSFFGGRGEMGFAVVAGDDMGGGKRPQFSGESGGMPAADFSSGSRPSGNMPGGRE